MHIYQLPQIIIDKYFQQINKQPPKSTWEKEKILILSNRTNPYWRIIFKDESYYYKIFDDTKIITLFNLAIKKNFFDNITKIKSYIEYNGSYIGYVYPICNEVTNLHLSQDILFNLSKQPHQFKELYENLTQNIELSKIFYTDLYYTNIVEYENKYYLIDIDSLSYLNNSTLSTIDKQYSTLPIFYTNFIKKLKDKKFMTRKEYRKIGLRSE